MSSRQPTTKNAHYNGAMLESLPALATEVLSKKFFVAAVETTFTGLAAGKEAQYDIELSWPAGQFFGGINITVACNATDDTGRPLAAVQPLSFAAVASPQLT